MSEVQNQVSELICCLKQQRDHLAVKIHLASMDSKDEFNRLSGKVDELKDQFEAVKSATGESAENVFSALTLAGEEMKNGLLRIGKTILG